MIDLDLGEHLLVTEAAARVGVRDLDELLECVLAVTDDVRRHAVGRRDELMVDDERPEVLADQLALDHHVA